MIKVIFAPGVKSKENIRLMIAGQTFELRESIKAMRFSNQGPFWDPPAGCWYWELPYSDFVSSENKDALKVVCAFADSIQNRTTLILPEIE